MEAATTRIFSTCALNRRLLLTKINVKPDSLSLKSTTNHLCFPSRNALLRESSTSSAAARIRCCSSLPSNPNLFKSLFSLTSNLHLQNPAVHANPLRSEPNDGVAVWNRAPRTLNGGGSANTFGESGKETTVVLLGWLGAKAKHLRRYLEWYNSRGINAVTFTVDVKDLLRFDLGRKLERRIDEFGNELVRWVSEREEEEEGREKCLVFHSFSNTGWLVYGALLESFVGRQELVEKIKGCIIDSGGADPLDTKIWAAGFTAAILKKRSSTINTEPNSPGNEEDEQKKEPLGIETMMLSSLETLFPIVLNIPEVNMRLTRITQKLYENHPPCPQLYLYSSGDKVVPSHSVENRIKEQQKIGRNVHSFNFKSSPHVDHYRNFPDLYSSQLHNFLRECFKPTKQQQAV